MPSFLKNTVLASLESQGLVHKAQRGRPLATDAERDEAIRQATKETRRAERNAVKNFKPVPAPKEPATTISEYGWRLGPDARSIQAGDAEASWGRDAGRWARAERMEEQFYRNKFRDMEATAERQRARRAAYKREKERFKAVKLEDERLGRSADVKREKMRLDALEKIQNYARITGEDVSDWYEELGQGPVEDVAELKKLMAREYGEMKRAKVLRR
jgi:hypothetical protein